MHQRIPNSKRKWRMNTVLLPMVLLLTPASGSMRFSILPLGNNIIDTTYVSYPSYSITRCAAVCHGMADCSIFTYDAAAKECHVIPELTEIIALIPAPASRITYFAWVIDGYIYSVTQTAGTWDDGKVACENLGGKMAVSPGTSFGAVIHHLYDIVYLGMWRPVGSTDVNTWYDIDGNVITKFSKWGTGQPNNYGGAQYIARIYQGFLDDNSDTNTLKALCAVPF